MQIPCSTRPRTPIWVRSQPAEGLTRNCLPQRLERERDARVRAEREPVHLGCASGCPTPSSAPSSSASVAFGLSGSASPVGRCLLRDVAVDAELVRELDAREQARPAEPRERGRQQREVPAHVGRDRELVVDRALAELAAVVRLPRGRTRWRPADRCRARGSRDDTVACWRPTITPPVNANDGIQRSSATARARAPARSTTSAAKQDARDRAAGDPPREKKIDPRTHGRLALPHSTPEDAIERLRLEEARPVENARVAAGRGGRHRSGAARRAARARPAGGSARAPARARRGSDSKIEEIVVRGSYAGRRGLRGGRFGHRVQRGRPPGARRADDRGHRRVHAEPRDRQLGRDHAVVLHPRRRPQRLQRQCDVVGRDLPGRREPERAGAPARARSSTSRRSTCCAGRRAPGSRATPPRARSRSTRASRPGSSTAS